MTARISGATERYAEAERSIWPDGLEPVDRWVDVGAPPLRLRVQVVGDGVPTLFVHGSAGPGACFAPLIAELDGIRSAVIDRPGWGLSEPVDHAGRPFRDIVVDALRATVDELGFDHVHLVGASIGNLWALRFAQAAPDRVDRVVLLGGGPISPENPVPSFIKLLRSPIGRVIVSLPEKPGIVRKQLAGIGHGESLDAGRLDGFISWRIGVMNGSRSARHDREMIRAVVDGSSFVPGFVPTRDEVASIHAPTLMVFGEHDPTGSVDVWERFTEGMPSGRLDVVPGAGHVVWLDDPAGVGRRVSGFLAG